MTTYAPPKVNTAYKFYVGLIDQSNTKLLKANPTIASGDFKVSTDGSAFANLATLPSANPASGRAVMIDCSAGEMNGANIVIQCVDAAGAEWCDLMINLQTTARQVDDLAYPATSGRSMGVDASGRVLSDVDTIKTNPVVNGGTFTFPTNATGASTTNITAGTITTATNLTTNNDKTGYSLTQSFPTNFASFAITAGGAVTAGTVSDKTGYSLSATGLDLVVMSDLSAPPASGAKITDGLSWTFMSVQNKRVTDSAGLTDTIANAAGATVGTATISDVASAFTKGKYA